MFNIGEYVKLKNSNITGIILSKKGNDYKIRVENRSTVINIDEEKIEKLYNKNNTRKTGVKISYSLNNKKQDESIMLRHQTKQEALENLDRFIFSSIANNIKRVKIIHGRNGGILRNAVHEYLKESSYIESFHIADSIEGSIGVTIAYLKNKV